MKQGIKKVTRGSLFCALFLIISSLSFAQEGKEINGVIVDEDSQVPLPGVTITEKGTNNGTITDFDGNFQLKLSGDRAVLIIDYLGYKSQEIEVENEDDFQVAMEEDQAKLDEVVVIGYGQKKKKDLTGAISSLDQADITSTPVTNALESMQGKIPGLDLTRQSGESGSGLSLRLRGNRSLNASNEPLVVVDGFIHGSTVDINPNDIESIQVLKDASSTAIYGTLGANGVILITTKSGVPGKTKISVNSYFSIRDIQNYADIMDGPQWVDLRRESRRTVGEWSNESDDEDIFVPEQLENFRNGIWTNWADELLGTGYQQNHQFSISGGSDKTKFYFSLEYLNEKGLLKNDELNRYSGRLNLSHEFFDNLKISSDLSFNVKDHDKRKDPLNQANKMSPLGPAYDEDGNVKTYPVGDTKTINPLNDEVPGNYINNEKGNHFFGNISLEWRPIDNLTLTSRVGLDYKTSRAGMFANTNTIEAGAGGLSVVEVSNNSYNRLTWENIANYKRNFGKHEFELMVGNSIWKTVNENYISRGKDLASPTMSFHNLNALASEVEIFSDYEDNKMASFFGRLDYGFNGKYLFTGVVRADGSSVLAKGNKWGVFPSGAFSWVLSEEDFLKEKKNISLLKARVSYGQSGNSAVDPYLVLGGLSKSTYVYDHGSSEFPAFGFYPSLLSSNLSWETTTTLDFGIELGFFNNRISGDIDLYQSNTDDLLMRRAIPSTSGYSSAWDNVGETRNRGIEIGLHSVNIDNKKLDGFKWSTDITFTANQEEIRKLSSGQERDLANSWFVGEPISTFYDYEKIGIWQLDEEELASSYGQKPGEIKVKDQDDNGEITTSDRTILGSEVPDYTVGFKNQFSFKGFELNVFVYARQGQTIVSEAAGSYKIDALENGPMVDYWTPENPTNAYPRPDAGTSRASAQYYSTLQYVDGSFVKIKDITLAYNFSEGVVNRLKLSNLRLYVTAKDYFTFSKLRPYDPERGGALSFPMSRQMVFGINIGI